MTNDPVTELRTARPTHYEAWGSSQEGLDLMHRVVRQGAKDSRATPRRRRLRSVVVVAVGSVILGGVAAQAVGVPGFRDEPSKESLVAEADKGPLFPADDGPQPNRAQAALTARISEILTPRDSKSGDGVPPQFASGIVGFVGAPATGYTLIVGEGVDVGAAAQSVLEGLSADSAIYLDTRVADHTTAELARVWRAVMAEKWSSSPNASYSLDVAATSGQIEVTVDPSLPADDRDRLQKVGGDALKIVQGGTLQRF